MSTTKRILTSLGILLYSTFPASAGFWDCLWGGSNEETQYTSSYIPGMGGVTLNQVASPPMNLGAPPPGIPVQATPGTQAMTVPQATIPTITSQTGPVGTVGQPATQTGAAPPPQAPPGTEILYVLPVQAPASQECLDGVQGTPAMASTVVAPGTPGAIPVAVKTVSVVRPKVEYQLSYSPIRNKKETLVQVVHPKTGKVVRTYCRTDEEKSSLPWPHWKEVVTYETVQAKVGTPVSLPQPQTTSANTVIRGNAPTGVQRTANYPLWDSAPSIESNIQTTIIVP